jgi:hypothetical protein
MIEITSASIKKAINKARQTKPFVKVIEFRRYQVTNKITGASYEVKFSKLGNKKLAECNCKATVICYHIGASIGAHIVLAERLHTALA